MLTLTRHKFLIVAWAGSGRNTSQDTNTVGENPEIYLPEQWLTGSMSAINFA